MIELRLYPAEIDRVTDALEILANNYNVANMIRAREKCLELRAKIIQQQIEGPPQGLSEQQKQAAIDRLSTGNQS